MAIASIASVLGWSRPSADRRKAREWQVRAANEASIEAHAEALRFEEMLQVRPGEKRIIQARARNLRGEGYWVALPTDDSPHSFTEGASGTGKTVLAAIDAVQRAPFDHEPSIVVDGKGEFSRDLIETYVPALYATGRYPRLLEHLRVVRPFSEYIPELRLTRAESHVDPAIQAMGLASALAEAIDDELKVRMDHVFLQLAQVAIEKNLPLPMLGDWLEQPGLFEQVARTSADERIREYARSSFRRESRSTLDALQARISQFCILKQVRLALSAPWCLDFHEAFERGLTIIDVGTVPSGAERAARFLRRVLMGRLTRAILSREVSPASPRCHIYLEEFADGLSLKETEAFERLLAQSRYKRCTLHFITQQLAQLPTDLSRVLLTNVGVIALFRSGYDDAVRLAHALPVSDSQNVRQERQRLIEEIPRLPKRTFYLYPKHWGLTAQKVRSPRLDLDAMRRAADSLPRQVREQIRRGIIARPIGNLERELRAEEAKRNLHAVDPEWFSPGGEAETSSLLPRLG